MTDLVLNTVASGYNLSLINSNFTLIEDKINDYCLQMSGGNNVMSQDLDMNGYSILNIQTDWSNPESMVTVGDAQNHFYAIGLVPATENDTDAVNLGQVSQMIVAAQLGTIPANVALYSELADVDGADLIGYAAGVTVKDKLDSIDASVASNASAISANTTATNNNATAISNIKSAGLVYSKDYADLQSALDAAAGKTLIVEPKSYTLTVPLRIKSGTTMWCYGATFVRGAAGMGRLMSNDSDGTIGGYGANSNISVLGGTWDGAYATYPGATSNIFSFGHCSNLTFRDITFLETTGWHQTEINACANVLFDNCYFYGGASQGGSTTESLQIDAAIGPDQFFMGPYDNTVCRSITVNNCHFINPGTGVGTHSDPTSQHLNIKIIGCYFQDAYWAAIRGQAWSGVQIIGNTISGGYHGILSTPAAAFSSNDWLVEGNTVSGVGTTGYSGASQGRPISMGQNGTSVTNQARIIGNTVKSCTGNAEHGIYFNGSQKFTCTGNIVDSVNAEGIYCNGGSYGEIICNMTASAGNFGIRVGGSSSEVTVIGNRAPNISVASSTKCVYANNIVTTSQNVAGMTSSITTPNLVNGVST